MRRARPRESRGKADKQAAEDGEPPRYTLRRGLARTVIEYGDRRFEVHKPEYLRLTSPSGDIGAVFDTEPKFDRGRKEPYFASEHPSVRGFYPERGEVLLTDGGRLTFDKDGALRKAELQGRPPLEVGYEKPVAQPASGPAKATSLPAHVIRSSPYGPPGGRRAKAVRNPKTGQVVRVSEL